MLTTTRSFNKVFFNRIKRGMKKILMDVDFLLDTKFKKKKNDQYIVDLILCNSTKFASFSTIIFYKHFMITKR